MFYLGRVGRELGSFPIFHCNNIFNKPYAPLSPLAAQVAGRSVYVSGEASPCCCDVLAPFLAFLPAGNCSVEPWDCEEGTDTSIAALQMINLFGNNNCSRSEIRRLDLATGLYSPVSRPYSPPNKTC